MENRIWYLFYYNSLPDMPKFCKFFSNQIIHRDYLICNPTNTGHYQYPKFEFLVYDEGCHHKEVKKLIKLNSDNKYVIFYTRHTELNGNRTNKIVGYFKVGKILKKPLIGFQASESVLLPKDECIPIKYCSKGVPVSWGNSKCKDKINNILDYLIKHKEKDFTKVYAEETKHSMTFLSNQTKRKMINNICSNCDSRKNCYWGYRSISYREKKIEDLYRGYSRC